MHQARELRKQQIAEGWLEFCDKYEDPKPVAYLGVPARKGLWARLIDYLFDLPQG